MATTSPDNIWTPDSGDDYALTTDLAATADSVQDALTKKGNYGVGTSAERTAALGAFSDGALWYDTTTSTEWRRVSGAWVNQDTGWTTSGIVLNSNFTGVSGLGVRKKDGLVECRFNANLNISFSTTSNGNLSPDIGAFNVPTGFRPASVTYMDASITTGSLVLRAMVNFTGDVTLTGGGAPSQSFSPGNAFNFSGSWFVG